jgi:hypothetical protein
MIGFGKPYQAMQISPGDAKAARGKRFIAIILADRRNGKLNFVFVDLPLERSGRLVIANVNNFIKAGLFLVLHVEGRVFGEHH